MVVHRHFLRRTQHLAHAGIAVVGRNIIGVVPREGFRAGVVVGCTHPGAGGVEHAWHAVFGDEADPVVAAVFGWQAREAAVSANADRYGTRSAVGDGALVVGKDEVEHHQVDFLHLFVKSSRVRCRQQAFDTGHRP